MLLLAEPTSVAPGAVLKYSPSCSANRGRGSLENNIPILLLKDKTAIATGGTTGNGRGIVLHYPRQGANVVAKTLGLEQDRELERSLVQEAEEIRQSSW
jgi:hypothetical protein